MTIRKYFLISFFVLCFVFSNSLICASEKPETVTAPSTTVQLTDSEQAWLDAHPEIRVGIMNAWPPMNFVDERNNPRGVGVDYIKLLNKRLNGALTIVPRPFKESYDLVKNKKLGVLMDITHKREREPFFNFTKPYLTIPHVIVGRKDGPYFSSEKDLVGKTIALERGFYNIKYFRKNYPEVTIKEYDSTSDAMDAVSRGETDAYAGNRAVVMYLIEKELFANLQVQGRMSNPPVVLAIGVRKDWPELASILDRALESVTEEEIREISRRWAGLSWSSLTPEEKAWLKDHPVLRLGVDPSWAPVEYFDHNGELAGITADNIRIMENKLGSIIEPVKGLTWVEVLERAKKGEIDIISAITKSEESAEYLLFTKPYLKLPMVVMMRAGASFIEGIDDLHDKTIAVMENYITHTYLKRDYPEQKLLLFETLADAIQAVAEGKADAVIENMASLNLAKNEQGLTHLNVVATTPYSYDISFGVRKDWPQLIPILEKGLAGITDHEKEIIKDKWVNIRFKKQTDWQMVFGITLAVILIAGGIVTVILISNRRLASEVNQRKQAEEAVLQRDKRLRLHYENTPLGVIEWGPDFKVVDWNQAAEQIFGYTREEALGKEAAELIIPESARQHVDAVWEQLLSREGGEGSTNENVTKDGRTILCTWHNTPLISEQEQGVGAVSLVEDITAKKRAENERQKHTEELERFNKAMVGREKRIIEFKSVINQLRRELGREALFASADKEVGSNEINDR